MRASGPGGEHVNPTESAVRVTHLPSGLHAPASEERSQHRNRRLALARLVRKLAEQNEARVDEAKRLRWQSRRQRVHDMKVEVRPRGETPGNPRSGH